MEFSWISFLLGAASVITVAFVVLVVLGVGAYKNRAIVPVAPEAPVKATASKK